MKIKLFSLSVLFFGILSCSKDDETPVAVVTPPISTVGDDIVTTFLPTTLANRWTYDTQTIVDAYPNTLASTTTGLDELFVDSEVTLNNLAFKLMKTSPINPTGFYSTMLNNNKVRIDGSSVKVTGNISFVVSGSTLNLTINDFTTFKENAVANTVVGDTGDLTITQTVQGLPVTAIYRLTSTATGTSANVTYNGNNYTDIKKNILKLRLSASTQLSIGAGQFITVPILLADDVIISDQYYSKNIGLVKAITKVEYHVNNDARPILPATAPADGLQNITENLKLKNF